jgi:demethylmenaquinone methyltransferase / 2-methoxy-6-polyprenyl-1,4-benzoquinol methylase
VATPRHARWRRHANLGRKTAWLRVAWRRQPSWKGYAIVTESGRLPAEGVRRMFDRIAPVYDAMNRVMTVGLDQRWRRATVREAVRPGDSVLDACCGTGDLAVAAWKAGAGKVVGLDFSEPMLERARRKAPELEWIQGDVLALPFEDGSFDAAVVGFGVRNVEDLEAGLRELRRVLRPGGRLGILEITTPRGVLAPFYRLWFDRLVPLLGRVLPGGDAYTYLPASVRRFPGPEALTELLTECGFGGVRFRLFAGGIVALHVGEAA